jgi:hypothetical protein
VYAIAVLLFAGLVAVPAQVLSADNQPPDKATFNFTSILARNTGGGDVKFKGIGDKQLQAELKRLNYDDFEKLNSGSVQVAVGGASDYKMLDGQDYYCKIEDVKVWANNKNKVTDISFTAVVVKRGDDGDEEVVTVERSVEPGKYLIIVCQGFIPAADGGKADDLVLAIQPTE